MLNSQNIQKLRAFAKINLLLRVTGKRSDGFHEIQTVMHSIDLEDVLFFEALEHDDDPFLIIKEGTAPDFSHNLIGDAWRLLREEFPVKVRPVSCLVEKHIPSGAGLGGGSADAAATLVALNRMFDLQLDDAALEQRARSLGSDVPFFIRGGCQLATGRGELLEPLEPMLNLHGVLVRPDVTISTAQAYGAFSLATLDAPLNKRELAARLANLRRGGYSGSMENSFERTLGLESASGRYRQVQDVRRELMQAGCLHAMLTGSGSAVFGPTVDAQTAIRIAKRLQDRQLWVHAVRGVDKGWE